MKNYKKLFYDNNEIIIGQYNDAKTLINKKIENKKTIIFRLCMIFWSICVFMTLYINTGWKFLGFNWKSISFINFDGNVDWFPCIMMTCLESIVTGLIIFALLHRIIIHFLCRLYKQKEEIKELDEQLRKKAADFGTTVYFDDIITALSTTFTLNNDFKERLKDFIEGHYLSFDFDTFDPCEISFSYLAEEEEQLVIQYEGCIYYFTGWNYYEDFPFRFFFDKVNSCGKVEEDIIFQLPTSK